MTLVERFHVNGEPRDAELADLNGDGWNDVIVVIRDADKVQAYANVQGNLVLSSEAPVGKSPRELAVADFNNDGCKDFVVVNRGSFDVSVLLGCGADAVGFQQLDQTYPVDGEVAGLLVVDLNSDARADVVQLHRASSEISVRLSGPAGHLSEPALFATGLQPNGFETADINGDGKLDVVTANLGDAGAAGTISILIGDGAGRFGAYSTVALPVAQGQPSARLLAVKAADFDGDGDADLVVSFADNRIAFFRGRGDGAFLPGADYSNGYPGFVFETRQFAAGDFDQDGDVDLAGVGFYGELGVVANDGQLISKTIFSPARFGAPELDTHLWYRAREIRLEHLNGDNDPDIVIGLDAGVAVFHGAAGATFEPGQFQSAPGVPLQRTLPEVGFSVSGLAFGDFDTDGDRDLAVSCFVDGCLTILTRDGGAPLFREAVKVKVPSAEFVATGDIDGDGKADLAGSGRTALWVALSGHRPEVRPTGSLQFERVKLPHPVINEIMSSNQKTLVGSAGDRYPDWVELYNPQIAPIDLQGWKLILIKDDGTTESYTFPAAALQAAGRKIVLCANNPGPDLLNTGYRLPDSGATLCLLNPAGTVIDTVRYPEQKADIAYARFGDGVSAFTSTAMASPGSPNVYTGPISPSLKFRGFDPKNFTANTPLQLFAEASDDSAVVGVSLSWRRVDIAGDPWHRVVFYDDGAHQEGALGDGVFAGTLTRGLPDGAAIQFYVEATDANNMTTYLPAAPDSAEDSGGNNYYTLGFGTGDAPIEISEAVADNRSVLVGAGMETPDYVEIRNVSDVVVALDDYGIVDSSLDATKRFVFPAGTVLQPGATFVVICDSRPDQGPSHANFRINADGDKIYLQRRTAAGVFVTVDAVDLPPLASDLSYSRIGARGEWEIARPTPDAANVSGTQIRCRLRSGEAGSELVLAFPVTAGANFVLESCPTLNGPWTVVASGVGTRIEGTFVHRIAPGERQRFFRVRNQ